MKIETFKKTSSGKYKLKLENNEVITTYDDVIINNNLLYKKEIDNDTLNIINKETKYYEIYNKVIKYISTKLRSEKEIINYLDKYSVEEKDKNKIIKDLKNIGLINDLNYIKAYISDRLYLSNDGINKIKKELVNQDINIEDIESEIEKIDKNIIIEKINKLVIKKIKANTKYSNYMLKQKIVNDLINLGYDRQDIINSIENNLIEDSNIIKKEYNKLYNKLSKKYKGEELEKVIKQKLYQKGFSIEEIKKTVN